MGHLKAHPRFRWGGRDRNRIFSAVRGYYGRKFPFGRNTVRERYCQNTFGRNFAVNCFGHTLSTCILLKLDWIPSPWHTLHAFIPSLYWIEKLGKPLYLKIFKCLQSKWHQLQPLVLHHHQVIHGERRPPEARCRDDMSLPCCFSVYLNLCSSLQDF